MRVQTFAKQLISPHIVKTLIRNIKIESPVLRPITKHLLKISIINFPVVFVFVVVVFFLTANHWM